MNAEDTLPSDVEPVEHIQPDCNPTAANIQPGALYEAINQHILWLVEHANERDYSRSLELTIEATWYPGSRDIDVKYKAKHGYGDQVESRSLLRSLDLLIDRHFENESIKPLSLPRP